MPQLLFGTYAPDITNYQGQTGQKAQNVLPRGDGYGPVKAFGAFSLPLVSGNDSTTKILLHLDSTNFADVASGVTPATWTAASTAVTSVNSTTFKFGGGSLQLGGVASSYITAGASANFAVGSNDFTCDFWIKPTTSNVNYNILGQCNSTPTAASTSFFFNRTGSVLKFALSDGTNIASVTGSTLTDSTAFVHIAGMRRENFLYLFANGTLQNTPASVSSVAAPTPTNNFSIGRIGEVTTSTFAGFIDEVRLTTGAIYPVTSATTSGSVVFNAPVAAYGPLPAGACRGFFYARASDGSIVLFAGSLNRLWKLDNTTLGWADVSKSLLNGYSDLPSTDHWQFAQFGNFVIAVQANTVPQVFTLGSSSQFGDLAGSPPQARYVGVVNRILVLTGLLSTPFRIQWSDVGDATNWTSGGVSVAGSQDLPDGGIVRGVAGGDYGVVFQDNAIRRLTYQPGASSAFQIERVTEDLGLLAPYSIIRAGSNVYFLSNKGFHAINSGNGLPVPIGKDLVDQTFFNDLDRSNLQLILGAADPESQRILWAYKSGAGQSGLFDKLMVYDTALNRWSTIVDQTGEFLGTLAAPGLTLDNLALAYPNLDTLPFSLDAIAIASLPKAALFNSTHALGLFTGSNLEAIIETPEQAIDGRRVRVRGIRPDTDAASCYGSLGSRERLQDAVTYTAEQAVDITGQCPANVSTRMARGRLRIPAGVTWTFASGFEPTFRQEGKR